MASPKFEANIMSMDRVQDESDLIFVSDIKSPGECGICMEKVTPLHFLGKCNQGYFRE